MVDVPERYNASLLLDRNMEAGLGDKVAISCGDEKITYRELLRRVSRFGAALKGMGARREERVVLVLNDSPAFPVAFFGAIRAGCVPVPSNPLLKAEDQRYFIVDSYARVVVVDHEYYETVQKALDGHPEQVAVIVANGSAPGATALSDLLRTGPDTLPPADTHRDDMAFM
ncbi:MAG: AMP-binding protein, partial [bacterium]